MRLIKDDEKKEILILDDNENIRSFLHFVPSFFIWEIGVGKPIILTKEDDLVFYNNLVWLFENDYIFPHEYSWKTDSEIVWFSEHCQDIDDEFERSVVSRIIIKKVDNRFYISFFNPFYEANDINQNGIISFSGAGNGYLVMNKKTGLTLQDDVIKVFNNTLCEQEINSNYFQRKKKRLYELANKK